MGKAKGRQKTTPASMYILNRDSHWDITLNNCKSQKCFIFFSIHFPCLLEWKRNQALGDLFRCALFIPWSLQDSELLCSSDKHYMSCYWSVPAQKVTKTNKVTPSPFWQSLREKPSWLSDPESILLVWVTMRRRDHENSTLPGCPQQLNMNMSILA